MVRNQFNKDNNTYKAGKTLSSANVPCIAFKAVSTNKPIGEVSLRHTDHTEDGTAIWVQKQFNNKPE